MLPIKDDIPTRRTPIVTLALGWIGTIVGMQFYLPMLVRIPGDMYRLAFFEALISSDDGK